MDSEQAKDKLRDYFSWENIVDNLPAIFTIGGILLLLDKLLSISAKLQPLVRKRRFRKNKMFETIDTVGDNVQLLNSIVKLTGLELSGDELKKIGDVLQNIGTGGKHLANFYELLGIGKGSKRGGGYKELQ